MTEIWMPVPGYETYLASTLGRIVRIDGHQPKQRQSHNGYSRVRLGPRKTRRELAVNRIILRSFTGEPPTEEHQAAHINGVCDDNRLENLYWATPKENAQDRILHGTQTRGSTHGEAKLTEEQVVEIRAKCDLGIRQKDIAAEYGVSSGLISQIKTRLIWRHC